MMARGMISICLFVLFILTSSLQVAAPSASVNVLADSTWTIMVYMADDTTSSLNWQDDLNEMEAARQRDNVRIIALVDPYGPNNSLIYRVVHDPNMFDPSIVSSVVNDSGMVVTDGEADMAAPTSLQSFVQFGASTYPADHTVLVLWGHGAGWLGLCPDGVDLLTLPELSQALNGAKAATGEALDLVIIDSCAEATVETLWQLHDSVRYFIGSEKDVPFQGLPYEAVINDLTDDSSQNVVDFAMDIVDEYVLWSTANTDYSVTMGVFDLSKMGSLVSTLEDLSVQGAKYDPIFHETFRTAFNDSETYEEDFSVDYGHFLWQLQNADLPLELRYTAHLSMMAKEDVIVYFAKYSNPAPANGVEATDASGLAIHAPSEDAPEAPYVNISLASSSWLGFGRLLRDDTAQIANGPGPTVSYTSVEAPNDSAVITWPDGTQQGSIWVFRNREGVLSPLLILNSSSPVVDLRGMAGSLTLATSSYVNGSLASYRTVNITLHGTVDLYVTVSRNEQTADIAEDEYVVFLVTAAGEIRFTPREPTTTGYAHNASVRIPNDASIGDIVTIRVLDNSTGKEVGKKTILIPDTTEEPAFVNIEVTSSCGCPYQDVVPLFLAVLPGILILGFALSLEHENRRRKKGPSTDD